MLHNNYYNENDSHQRNAIILNSYIQTSRNNYIYYVKTSGVVFQCGEFYVDKLCQMYTNVYLEALHDIHHELFDVKPVHKANTARRVQHEDHVSLAIADNYVGN